MKEVNLPSGDYTLILVPDDAYDFQIVGNNLLFLRHDIEKNEGYGQIRFDNHIIAKIISTTNDITEEQCECIVKKGGLKTYKDYTYISKNLDSIGLFNALLEMKFKTAKESLQSLIQSVGLDLKNNYLILKK